MSVTKWVTDSAHSYIEFSIYIKTESPYKVYFRRMAGKIEMNEKFEDSSMELQWVTDSIESGDKGLDKFLTSADFFAADKVPMIKFQSEKISKLSDSQYGVRGVLNYGDHDEPISFNTKFDHHIVTQEDSIKRTGIYMSTQVDPRMFGIVSRSISFEKSIGIELELEFVAR